MTDAEARAKAEQIAEDQIVASCAEKYSGSLYRHLKTLAPNIAHAGGSGPYIKEVIGLLKQIEADIADEKLKRDKMVTKREVNYPLEQNKSARFTYTNYKSEKEERMARFISMWWGTSYYHPAPQMFIEAMDLEKSELRNFTVAGMENVRYL